MPTVTIKDDQGQELLSTNLTGEGLGKYLKAAASLRALLPTARVFSKPLTDTSGAREVALALDKDVPVGKNGELSISVGASAKIGLHESESVIFSGDLQAPVKVPNGAAYTSLTLEALLKAGLAGSSGSIGFGFDVGAGLRYAYFHPFDIVGGSPTVGEAVKRMLSAAVFPADADNLARLPVGAFVSLAGEGELSAHVQASMSSTTNLLATPGLPIIGTATIAAGASFNVGAEWTASGEFELRLSKPDPSTLHLAFHRRRGRSLSVSATASAGVSATLQGKDLLATLMRAISPDPEADLIALVNAGLDDSSIEAIQQAVAASIDRSLTLSAQLQVSALRESQALFAYDIDLGRLDEAGKAAVGDALHGRLSKIGEAAAVAAGPIRLVASAATSLHQRKTSWRINLLGIVNVASFVELVRSGSVTFDPVSGALTAADQVSSRRIRVKSTPLASDSEKLRKVLFESLMVTAAYQASRVLGSASLTVTADQAYVEQRGRTKRPDLEDHYRALIALGLCDEQERDARLAGEGDFGASTFSIQNHFDSTACDAMFLDGDGAPHAMAHYETIARQALRSLIPATDPARSFRRIAIEPDAMWARVRELGGAINQALPEHIRHDALRLNVVRGDVFTIVWWARAMSRAAGELAAMRKFLGQRDATSLHADPAFVKGRAKLSEALGGVVATTEARFDDPWDVLAMDAAAARLGELEGVIISTRFAARYTETALPAPAAPVSRSVRAAAATASASADAERDWTAEERDVFARHAVNLREGKLSSTGTVTSTKEQVGRIFTEFIPEYVAAQKAIGQRARVLFFAHGGLVEEREGLLPVLARRRFWQMNGVYPVYFVWETGLKETIRDILGGIVPTRAARGDVADLAIEKLARNGGKQVWGQMKKSAQLASDAGGGARLVAELAGALWKATNAEIEFHALGHSAGSIFHAFFLPVLVAQRPAGVPAVSVRTLHFLAPAITSDLFKSRLKGAIGNGQPITSLTTYTMADKLEQADSSLKPYGKSLLYLVSNAFEDAVPTPLLGMQNGLKQDLALIRFFGLAGTEKVADIAFSKTLDDAALNARTQSITHGGFDNDVATMTSVVRRVLDASDTTAVTDYFEDSIEGISRAAVGVTTGARTAAAPRAAAHARPATTLAVRPARGKKKWTVMVWMAGDNDLESFGAKDLVEMKRVGSTDDLNVVVQFDSMQDDHTRRYEMTKGGDPDGDIVQELGETNTGDPAVAIDFFRWAIERYPAERLLGVIWNHGSGIDDTDIYAPSRGAGSARPLVRRAMASRHRRALFGSTVAQATNDRAIAFDDSSRDFLDNVELKKVLADVRRQTGRTLDVLGFDACLMNMIEVAYQMKGTAHVVVGSEELEPGEGWPYDRVLQTIAGAPDITGSELALRIVQHYVDSYREGSVTQSAFDLARLDAAAEAIDALAKALTKAIKDATEFAAVFKALNGAQRFDSVDFVDLVDFCQELSKRSKSAAVKAAAKATVAALTARGGFVLAEGHKGASVSRANGAAIYFPRGPVNKAYSKLDFAKATAWRAFLDAFHKS